MAVSPAYRSFVLDQLAEIGPEAKRMFGGLGLFRDGLMFAVVDDDRMFFKVDERTRPQYEAAGSGPFEYSPGKQALGYFEVPAEVIEDPATLTEWARGAVEVAIAKDRAKPARLRKRNVSAPPALRKGNVGVPPARRRRKPAT